MNKRYWLRGLMLGLVFGILVAYAHEHAPLLLGWHLGLIQSLYSFSLYPFLFLGLGSFLALQYFLPAVTYGVLGILFGWAYNKFNKRIVIFLIVILILFIFLHLPLMRMALGA